MKPVTAGLLGSLLAAVLPSGPLLAAPSGARLPAEQALFDALERERLVEPGAATADDLARIVRDTHDQLVAGEAGRAAPLLYLVVEGPRYAALAGTPDFADAEYQLGIALIQGGAIATGRGYLERIAARPPKDAPFAEPALRRLIDSALARHDEADAAKRLDAAGVRPQDDSPLAQEIAYLRGRAAESAGRDDEAETLLRHVGPHCRFYTSAIYLRGVIAVKRGDLKAATDDFCVVVPPTGTERGADRDPDPLRFVIDGRYYAVRDLARLALARIAHEEGRYDDAFFHGFSIPDDSRELPHALFESAWSMLQGKRYALAGRLAEELLARFPDSPLAAEARLLSASLRVKTCRFASARRELDRLIAEYEPVERAVGGALHDRVARRALAQALLGGADGMEALFPEPLLARARGLLDLSPSFRRLDALARAARDDARAAQALEADWSSVVARLRGDRAAPVAAVGGEAASLLERTAALADGIASARALAVTLHGAASPDAARTLAESEQALSTLEERRAHLAQALARATSDAAPSPGPAGAAPSTVSERASVERAAAATLKSRLERLSARIDERRGELFEAALGELDLRIAALLRHARLGRIDAVVGEKKRLQHEIQDLAAGRFPPSMQSRLSIDGLIGDDEEYWPPERGLDGQEGERWADEYEGYK